MNNPENPAHRLPLKSGQPPFALSYLPVQARLQRSALNHSAHLGWAEITHPFHPHKGQRFRILKIRQISGIESLSLKGTSGGSFAVNIEWTDQAKPSASSSLSIADSIFNSESLLALVELTEKIKQKNKKVDK